MKFFTQKMPKVSVIIPCYNQGAYLAESIRSVLGQTVQDFEIIVVDDGSTDLETKNILDSFSAPKTRVIRSANQGVSAARNLGISHARGNYILPLDCDDRIAPGYLAKAGKLLDGDPLLGIVYCKAEFFGFQSGPWILPSYRFPECIIEPMIFCAALFRRADWQESGGYSTDLKHGFEDHDFWLGLIKRGRQVHCIDEVLFYYRRLPNSVTHALTHEKHVGAFMTIFRHHQQLFIDNIEVLIRGFLTRQTQAQAESSYPTIQLFADTGNGYTEFDSIRTRYSAGNWVVVSLRLPKSSTTQRMPLRLDPGMQAGCYDISQVELLCAGNSRVLLSFEGNNSDSPVRIEGTALRLPAPECLRILSFGTDPQIILVGLGVRDDVDTLRIKVRFQPSIESAADSFGMLKYLTQIQSLVASNGETTPTQW